MCSGWEAATAVISSLLLEIDLLQYMVDIETTYEVYLIQWTALNALNHSVCSSTPIGPVYSAPRLLMTNGTN